MCSPSKIFETKFLFTSIEYRINGSEFCKVVTGFSVTGFGELWGFLLFVLGGCLFVLHVLKH